jgi:hypothetical protein
MEHLSVNGAANIKNDISPLTILLIGTTNW